MPVKLGEVQTKMMRDVKKTDELSVHLRISFEDKLQTAKFKPSEDLKQGDPVKITIEKA